jgi:hypothetical protein
MKRPLSKNAKLVLAALPAIAVACAVPPEGDPPLPIPDPEAGAAGENQTGGTGGMTGGTGTGGTGVSGTSGTTGGTTGGSTGTGGATGGSTSTGGAAGQGGSSGSATGGSGGMTGGGAGKGGSSGSATGGSGGMTGGGAGKGGSSGMATGGSGMGGGAAGGPPSGMELLRENFEMGTSRWTLTPSGVWATAMDGSTVLGSTGATGSNANRSAVAGETTWTDVQIDARVKVTSFAGSSSGYYAGVCARYQSTSNYACFALRSNGQIMFKVNGSNGPAVDPSGGAIQEGTWYNVRVVARGANITAFLGTTTGNMVEIPMGSRVTSGAPTSGRIALVSPGTNAVFDDIVVTTP